VALYHLASVVDDAELGVTHVVRGSDKFSIAHYQEMVRIALGLEPKKFMHTPLMLGDDGKLLKGDVMYDSFLQKGILPQALVSYMISSGYGDPDIVYDSLSDFIDSFDYKKVRQADGKFSQKKLESINRRIFSGIYEDDYYISLKLYMAKFFPEKEVNDDYISTIQKLKIPFEKVESFLNAIEDPKYSAYEFLPEEVRDALRYLVSSMEKECFDINEFYFSANKSYLRALRFFLFGDLELSGGVREVFDLVSSKGLVSERVSKIKKHF
jgi:glutamyl/glutaminyl-tRNA synthetase